jgi:molybdopterin-guanine dinucleotide biosynthesis protein A
LDRCGFATTAFDFIDSPYGKLDPFFNINTPEDVEIASQFMGPPSL